MNKSFKSFFFFKKGNGYKEGPMPVYLRISVNGQRAEITVQRKCDALKWNLASGRATGKKSEILQLNQYLDVIQGKIFEIQKEHELKNEPLTAEIVKQKLLGATKEKQHSLLEVFKHHNDQFEALFGKEYSINTLKKFKAAVVSLQNFIQWKYQKKDIPLVELNHPFITEYEFYLKTVQNVQPHL